MLRSGVLLFFGLLLFISGWIYASDSAEPEGAEKRDDTLLVSRQKSIKKVKREEGVAAVAYVVFHQDSKNYQFVDNTLLECSGLTQVTECVACEHEAARELSPIDPSNPQEENPVEIPSDSQPVGRQRSITGGAGSLPKPKTVSIPLLKIHGGGHSSSNLYENTHSNILARNSHEPAVRAIAKASGDGLKSTRLCPFHRQVKGDTPIPTKRAEIGCMGSPLVCLESNDSSPDADSLTLQFASKMLLTPESHTIDETFEVDDLVPSVISSSSSEEEIVKKTAAFQLAKQDLESKTVEHEMPESSDSTEGCGPVIRLAIAKHMLG